MDDNLRSWLAHSALDAAGVARRAENFTARRIEGSQVYSLVRVQAGAEQAYRVTLGRLVAAGHRAPSVQGAAPTAYLEVPPQGYPYAAAVAEASSWYPARRSYPVFGLSPLAFGRVWVELAWGIDQMSANRMVVDWPAMGGSIVLPGSYVEVSAIVTMTGTDQMTDADMPTGAAMVMCAPGVSSQDGNEMSLAQTVDLTNLYGGAITVPDFARRVQVSVAQELVLPDPAHPPLSGQEFEVPATGDPPLRLVWLDDRGATVYTGYQRTSEPAVGGTPANAPIMWHPVPGRATMLALRKAEPEEPQPSTVFVHWRLAP